MGKWLAIALLSFNSWAFAADYSGCIPKGAELGTFSLSEEGNLVVVGAKREGLHLKRTTENTTEVFKLKSNEGRPESVTVTFPLFGDHNPQNQTQVFKFKYKEGKCYVDQVVLTYSHGEDKNKKLVTYDYAHCDELSGWLKGADNVGRRKGAKDIMDKYELKARGESMELFGYQPAMGRDESFETSKHALQACQSTRQRFPFAYTKGNAIKKFFGISDTGIDKPGSAVVPAAGHAR